MTEHVSSGQKAKLPSAALWNDTLDAGRAYGERHRLGERAATLGSSIIPLRVKMRNDTAAEVPLGSVLQFGTKLVTETTMDYLWFAGALVSRTDWRYGICLEPIAEDTIGECQTAGPTVALVNVSSESHEFADVESGSTTLVSAVAGPWAILSKPSGTGVKTCVVDRDGGSNSNCDMVRFQVVSSDPTTRTALGEILSRPVGCSDVPESTLAGTVIEICDPSGCYFNEPNVTLTGRQGWAKYMMPTQENICQPDINYLVPQWEVFALCCETPTCA